MAGDEGIDSAGTLDYPVITMPYEVPGRPFVIGPNGPTGEVVTGRRPSESFIAIPAPKKKRATEQGGFDLAPAFLLRALNRQNHA